MAQPSEAYVLVWTAGLRVPEGGPILHRMFAEAVWLGSWAWNEGIIEVDRGRGLDDACVRTYGVTVVSYHTYVCVSLS